MPIADGSIYQFLANSDMSANNSKADVAQIAPFSDKSMMKLAKMLLSAFALAFLGCWLLIENSVIADSWHLSGYLLLGFWALICVHTIVSWNTTRPSDYAEPSPAWSGASVLLATGGAGIVFLGKDASSASDLVLPIIVGVLTVVAASLVYRFASRHKKEIGEARFDTDRHDR